MVFYVLYRSASTLTQSLRFVLVTHVTQLRKKNNFSLFFFFAEFPKSRKLACRSTGKAKTKQVHSSVSRKAKLRKKMAECKANQAGREMHLISSEAMRLVLSGSGIPQLHEDC